MWLLEVHVFRIFIYKLTENNEKYKQIIKYKHIKQIMNKNINIKIQKCIDKTMQQCYYKTIKKNKRKTNQKESEIHSIHSIDAHERMKRRKAKVIPVGT